MFYSTQGQYKIRPLKYVHVMLWSQIKLPSYDFSNFSDLHITGEFNNRPGTGQLKKNLLRGHIITGACGRLYMIISTNDPPGTVL